MSHLDVIRERNAKKETVVDDLGRTFTVQRLTGARRLAVQEWTNSSNPQVSGTLCAAAMVRSVDGNPLLFPKNRTEADSTVTMLDEEGLFAVVEALAKMNPAQEKVEEAAKNSPGTSS